MYAECLAEDEKMMNGGSDVPELPDSLEDMDHSDLENIPDKYLP